jgi:hypothetical protein
VLRIVFVKEEGHDRRRIVCVFCGWNVVQPGTIRCLCGWGGLGMLCLWRQAPDDVAELVTRGSLLCQEIKAASRDVLLAAQSHKDRVQAAMAAADAENLQLDNLRYERSHLMREILKCKTVRCAPYAGCVDVAWLSA